MATITVHDPVSVGLSLTAIVRRVDTGAIINGAGDACTESDTDSGMFTFELTESRTTICRVDLFDAFGLVYTGWLGVTSGLVVSEFPGEEVYETLESFFSANDLYVAERIDALETKVQADARQTALIAEHDATQEAIAVSNDRLGYTLAALAGNCADAGTAAETYTITIGAETFSIDHTGLDATGNRGTAVLTKS
jgi:hypothetical protein